MSRICPYCGTEIDDNAEFCSVCGAEQKSFINNIPHNDQSYEEQFKSQVNVKKLPVASKTDGLSIVSLIFGIISILTFGIAIVPECIAIICTIVSRKKGNRSKVGTAGLICGIIGIILLILTLLS